MTSENYLQTVKAHFHQFKVIPSLHAEMYYEEKFELKWIATKLKQFSFVSSVDYITLEVIKEYSHNCINYALKEYKGMPRGLQNGVVGYNILVSDKVDDAAIEFVLSRGKKHVCAFEIPIIVDLAKQEIYYYKKTPMWGAIYYKHFRNYIKNNFGL